MKKKIKEYLISGDNFFPNTQAERTSILPAGAYECKVTMEGAPYFQPISIVTDNIIDLPNSFMEEMVNEIDQFWTTDVSDKFAKYGLVHKRGIILAGKPGTGKTIGLAKTAKMVIEKYDGLVIFNPDASMLKEFLRVIKDIEPNRKILVMWEEFDSVLDNYESSLLPLLDGEIQVGNIVYLATTNYLSKIPARIKNRPSRFAKVIEVGAPTVETRRLFLQAKLHESDMHLLEPMVQASEGFVIDQLKDMIISTCCFGYSIDMAVRKINEMQQESIGIDDYQEEQAQSVFQTLKKNNKSYSKGPLQPLR